MVESRRLRFAATCPLLVISILVSSAAKAEEWWHGSFVPTGSAIEPDPFEVLDCYEAPDTMVTYTADGVFPHETECRISEKIALREMQAVWIKFDCTYPDGPGGYEKSELLIRAGNGPHIMRYTPLEAMMRCEWPK